MLNRSRSPGPFNSFEVFHIEYKFARLLDSKNVPERKQYLAKLKGFHDQKNVCDILKNS